MRHRLTETVTIQQDVETVSAATNAATHAWVPYAKRSAEILTGTAREVFRAQQLRPETTHVVRLIYDNLTADINERMRLIWGTRTLGLLSVEDEDKNARRGRFVILQCAEQK